MFVGRAMFVSNLDAPDPVQVAQHQVNGREATDSIAVVDGGNFVVEARVIALIDGGNERAVAGPQLLTTGGVHGERIAERGSNVGKVYGRDGEHVLAGRLLPESGDEAIEALVAGRVVAVADEVLEGAAKDGYHGGRIAVKFPVKIVEPDGRKLDGVFLAVVQFKIVGVFRAEGVCQSVHERRSSGQNAKGGGIRETGEGNSAQAAAVVGTENEDEVGGGDGGTGPLPDLSVDGATPLVVDVGRDDGLAGPGMTGGSGNAVAVAIEEQGEIGGIFGVAEAGQGRWAMGLGAVAGELLLLDAARALIIQEAGDVQLSQCIFYNLEVHHFSDLFTEGAVNLAGGAGPVEKHEQPGQWLRKDQLLVA